MPLVANDTSGALTRARVGTWVAQTEKTTEVAMADAAVLQTAAQIIDSKIFKQTPSAARAVTTPTAALLVAAATDYVAGTTFEFSIINLAAATHVITLTAGVGVTLVGVATVQPVESARFAARIDSATAVTVYRLA